MYGILFISLTALSCISSSIKTMSSRNLTFRRIAFFWVIPEKIPYFFEFSMHSLLHSYSSLIDIHVIIPIIPKKYRNNSVDSVYFHAVDASRWKNRIKRRLRINIEYDLLRKGKKLADFKPFLGKLFSDFIPEKTYDWWAYGDMDGIYGSFDNIFNISILSQYDIISGYSNAKGDLNAFTTAIQTVAGPFTLLRNNQKLRNLAERSKFWRSMLNDSENIYAFDDREASSDTEETLHQVRFM